MASLTISGVRKNFGKTSVLRDVSIQVLDSEFVVLVGPSGCGKSTLLRILAGLEEMDAGEIHIGNDDVSDYAPRDRDIAMVFQSYALYPHMTVAQNMGFSMKLRKMPPADVEQRVTEAATILGLSQLLHRTPKELSGGQRQRVAMGRAIVRSPKVFLFDEPLSNLDAKLRISMRTELKALHQRLRTTTVYVTHDQIEAMTMADRIVVMRDGIIEQQGDPLRLYDKPVNLFVAGFIGSPSMNFMQGEVDGSDMSKFLCADGSVWQLDELGATAAKLGQRVVLGVRPEHFEVLPSPSGDNMLKFEVDVVEPTGAETQLFGSMAGYPIVAVLRDRPSIRSGDVLWLKPRAQGLHVFDAKSEVRLS